jgi:hypothetical protein
MSTPRILVEGGPVDVRTKHILAALLGLLIGAAIAIGGLAVTALKASHDAHLAIQAVKNSRREATLRTCEEDNEHHRIALVGVERLALKITAGRTPAEVRAAKQTLDEFAEALAPSYDCAARVRLLTKP